MKKNLLMTAFLVVTTAFIGCSSDENLAELQGGDPVPAKGTPMTVTVSDGSGDATRYANITTDNIAYFQMWAYNTTNQTDQNTFMTNYGFSKTAANGTKFTNSIANWPATNTDPCFFYAVSENGTTSSKFDAPNFEASGTGTGFTPKLIYSLPTTRGTVQMPGAVVPDGVSAKMNPVDTLVVDTAEIKDLLVCTNKGVNNAGITEKLNGSNLTLAFNHALADLEIAARFTSYEWIDDQVETQDVGDDAKININYIAIHGLYTEGTYNFNTGWEANSLGKKCTYLYKPAQPIVVTAQNAVGYTDPTDETSGYNKPFKRTTIVPAGKLLFIPQAFTSWAGVDGGDDIAAAEAEEQAYVEVNLTFEDVNEQEGIDDVDIVQDGVMSFYFPLKFTNNTDAFVAGKKHKMLLNLNFIRYPDGSPALAAVGLDI